MQICRHLSKTLLREKEITNIQNMYLYENYLCYIWQQVEKCLKNKLNSKIFKLAVCLAFLIILKFLRNDFCNHKEVAVT